MKSEKFMPKVPMFNINIDNISKADLLRQLHSGLLVTPNVDHVVKLQKDKELYDIYQAADWVICDSRILSLASKLLGNPIKEVIPGSSFFYQYCEYHRSNSDIKIFLLGAKPGVAWKAMENVNEKIGREIVVGAHSPSFGFEKDEVECSEIVNKINASEATVLVVGVGAPKQEKWIYKYKSQFTKIKLFMPLGATIDFEAGNIKRAPKLFQQLHIEWLFRLLKEPRRLWKRYLIDDSPFFYYVFLQKIGRYRDPFIK